MEPDVLECALPSAGEPPAGLARRPEPAGDPIQRATLRMSLLAFYGGGMFAVSALFLPGGVFLDPVGGLWRHLPADPPAHARGMALGFISLFVLSFLCRMVPRGTRTPLVRPRLALAGAVLLLAATLVDVAGALRWGVPGGAALGLLWLGAVVCWAGSLGATWRDRRGPLPWFAGWIGGGLVGMAVCFTAGGLGALFGSIELVERVAVAVLFGGLTPIAAGLSVKMLPALGGVGPSNRALATVPTSVVAGVGVTTSAGLLAGEPLVALVGVMGLVVLVGVALRAMGWLGLRRDGDQAVQESRRDPDVRALRWSGRVAWLWLILGLLLAQVALGAQAWGLALVAGHSTRDLLVLATHLVGGGFLVTLMLGVGQRLLPGFVRADVRWTRLRHAVWILMLSTVALRAVASLIPARVPWALQVALGLLLLAVVLFQLQVGRSIRSPGER
jgi:hypothetical protein